MDTAALYRAFLDRRLPHDDWTHEAHLTVCWHAVGEHGRAGALQVLRRSIRAYNEATGRANTETDGYHETLTRYYVGAVAHAAARRPEELFDDPQSTGSGE